MLLIERERRLRRVSQSKLAQQADMNPSSVCAIERGRLIPSESQRRKLRNALVAFGWRGDEAALFAEAGDEQ